MCTKFIPKLYKLPKLRSFKQMWPLSLPHNVFLDIGVEGGWKNELQALFGSANITVITSGHFNIQNY